MHTDWGIEFLLRVHIKKFDKSIIILKKKTMAYVNSGWNLNKKPISDMKMCETQKMCEKMVIYVRNSNCMQVK